MAVTRRAIFLALLVVGGVLAGVRPGLAGEPPLIETVPELYGYETARDFRTGQKGVFVGKVSGTDAFIAIKVRGNEVLVYLCDQEVPREPQEPLESGTPGPGEGTIWRWLEGEIVNGVANLTSTGGVEVTFKVGARAITGNATFGGETNAFRAVKATAPGAGLFRSTEEVRISGKTVYRGWIFLNNGEARGDNRFLSYPCSTIVSIYRQVLEGGVSFSEYGTYVLVRVAYIALSCWRVA